MPLHITSYITSYVTRYQTRFMGIITKVFMIERVRDEEGEEYIVTRIVKTVTVPYIHERKTMIYPVREWESLLKEVVSRKRAVAVKR